MSVTASGLYVQTWMKTVDATQLALAPLADAVNIALYTNSITPNFSTDTAYSAAPYTSNEIPNGGGYTTGGVALGSKTYSELNASQITFDAADAAWASSTITNARAALIYDNTLAGKNVLALINFGSDFSTVSGTFTITFAAAGIFYIKAY